VKKQVSISIRKDVAEQAHQLGINISKVSENHLIFLIETIKNAHLKDGAGPMGFEPMTFSLEGTAKDWNKFRNYLKDQKYCRTWESTLFNYAQQYAECLFSGDLSKIRELPDSKRPNVLKALSALAKFTGRYEAWKAAVRNFGLRWIGTNASDVFINRLSRTSDSEDVWNWIKEAKAAQPRLSVFLDYMALTGLRFIEAINSYNLIVSLAKVSKLNTYYNAKEDTLDHWRFKETFIRSSKKAFVSFVPAELIEQISVSDSVPTAGVIQRLFNRKHLPARFGDIREAHATFLTKYLKEAEINFLHGRVTSSVFMANYFNPALIGDLKARTFQATQEIQIKIQGVIE
jgi:intergrase/recombinase